jgi:hypothetical protein
VPNLSISPLQLSVKCCSKGNLDTHWFVPIPNFFPPQVDSAVVSFSFVIPNPVASSPPFQPTVKFMGNGVAFGGPRTRLKCVTFPGCVGVQSSATPASIISVAAYEQNRFAGQLNTIFFIIQANTRLQQLNSVITVSGIFGGIKSGGSGDDAKTLLLDRCPGTLSRAAQCDTKKQCTIMVDTSSPPATIRISASVQVLISCSDVAPGQVKSTTLVILP